MLYILYIRYVSLHRAWFVHAIFLNCGEIYRVRWLEHRGFRAWIRIMVQILVQIVVHVSVLGIIIPDARTTRILGASWAVDFTVYITVDVAIRIIATVSASSSRIIFIGILTIISTSLYFPRLNTFWQLFFVLLYVFGAAELENRVENY